MQTYTWSAKKYESFAALCRLFKPKYCRTLGSNVIRLLWQIMFCFNEIFCSQNLVILSLYKVFLFVNKMYNCVVYSIHMYLWSCKAWC